jgi:hypothetical protein
MIDELPHDAIKSLIYRKGILNLLPSKVSSTLKNNYKDMLEPAKSLSANEGLTISVSTKSDEGAKMFKREPLFSIDSDDRSDTLENVNKHEDSKLESSQFKRVSLSKPALQQIQEKSSELIKHEDDVSQTNISDENHGEVNEITTGEEKVEETLVMNIEEDTAVADTQPHYEVIPISSSPNFQKNENKEFQNYSESMNIRTIVLSSNRQEYVGRERIILNHKQLLSLDCLIDSGDKTSNIQVSTLLNSNNQSEDDVFWDNLWLFKKREEEKRATKEDSDSDSEDETLPQRPTKIGEIIKNPHILIQIMLQKRFKKLRRQLLFINSIGGMSLMTIIFFVQLKYSRRFRFYTKTIVHLGLFIFTILGFGGSFFLMYKSIMDKRRRRLVQDKEKYDIKNEELPELESEIEFKEILNN